MKPRNKRECEVVELSRKLPPFTKANEWAKEHLFEHIAYKCAGWCWCSDCSHMWMMSKEELASNNGYIECPYCHKKLSVKVSRKQHNDESKYMTIVTTCSNYQVLRHIECKRYSRQEGSYLRYYFEEVVQEWIGMDGKRTIMARSMNTNSSGWLCDDLSIKNEYRGYYCYNDYAICGIIYPFMSIQPMLKKRGLSKRVLDLVTPSSIIKDLLRCNNDAELVIKTKQFSMLEHMSKNGYYQLKNKRSFNICNRNHYIIKDAGMWLDYIDLLQHFGKDIYNAKFVCPKNLKKEHDILMQRKEKKDAEIRRQREHERAVRDALERKEDILNFYKTHNRFFGIEISGNGITIHPLESVTQFYQEAAAMHHCVFTNRYYSHNDCLILSARDSDGKRLETIEVNLKTFQIVQSRAIYNGQTERHNEIINLIENNINVIKQHIAA